MAGSVLGTVGASEADFQRILHKMEIMMGSRFFLPTAITINNVSLKRLQTSRLLQRLDLPSSIFQLKLHQNWNQTQCMSNKHKDIRCKIRAVVNKWIKYKSNKYISNKYTSKQINYIYIYAHTHTYTPVCLFWEPVSFRGAGVGLHSSSLAWGLYVGVFPSGQKGSFPAPRFHSSGDLKLQSSSWTKKIILVPKTTPFWFCHHHQLCVASFCGWFYMFWIIVLLRSCYPEAHVFTLSELFNWN